MGRYVLDHKQSEQIRRLIQNDISAPTEESGVSLLVSLQVKSLEEWANRRNILIIKPTRCTNFSNLFLE